MIIPTARFDSHCSVAAVFEVSEHWSNLPAYRIFIHVLCTAIWVNAKLACNELVLVELVWNCAKKELIRVQKKSGKVGALGHVVMKILVSKVNTCNYWASVLTALKVYRQVSLSCSVGKIIQIVGNIAWFCLTVYDLQFLDLLLYFFINLPLICLHAIYFLKMLHINICS